MSVYLSVFVSPKNINNIYPSFRIRKSIWILLLNKFSCQKTRLKVLKLLKAAALARHNGRACLDFLPVVVTRFCGNMTLTYLDTNRHYKFLTDTQLDT